MLHLPGPLAHLGAQEHLAARRKLDDGHGIRQRALVGHRELADLLHLVAEELHAPRMLGDRREHVEDAAAHGELAAAGDHVDAGVCEIDELGGQVGEVVAAPAGHQFERLEAREVVGERLQGGAHARDHDEVAYRLVGLHGRLPALEVAQGPDALADGLGARAQPLVRQRLPCGEFDHFGVRRHAGERAAQRLGVAAGRDDGEERLRPLSRVKQPGQQRGAEAVDEGEVRASGRVGEGVFERAGARERTV